MYDWVEEGLPLSRIRSISIVEEELKNVEEFIIGDKECLKIFPGYLQCFNLKGERL
jgi:hypothetical protein